MGLETAARESAPENVLGTAPEKVVWSYVSRVEDIFEIGRPYVRIS